LTSGVVNGKQFTNNNNLRGLEGRLSTAAGEGTEGLVLSTGFQSLGSA
jgi:hypothetical protein